MSKAGFGLQVPQNIADLFFAHLRLKVPIALQFQTFRDIAVKLVEALHITAFEHCSDILGVWGKYLWVTL